MILAKLIQKRMIYIICRISQKRTAIPKNTNSGYKNGMFIEFRLRKWLILLVPARSFIRRCSICSDSAMKVGICYKRTSQKEAEFFIVEEMHKYLDQGRNHLNHMMNNTDGDEKENYIKELKK